MKGNGRFKWLSGILPLVLGVLLLAGAVCLTVPAAGYAGETLTPPALTAGFADTYSDSPLEITFEDDPGWRTVISAVYVDDDPLEQSEYGTDNGKITVDGSNFDEPKEYDLLIKADGYTDARVTVDAAEPSTMDILYEGTVALAADETFTVTADNSNEEYTVKRNTPLGALQAAAIAGGFNYSVTDKNFEKSGALLLNDVGSYKYKDPGKWYAYVNDEFKDGYNNRDGALNLIQLVDGDRVEFYYADGIDNPEDLTAVKAVATAGVKTVELTALPQPSEGWTLEMIGDVGDTITREEFEQGLACADSDHYREWKDNKGNVWSGVPLWVLLGAVDDIETSSYWTFNDDVAAGGYSVKVVAGDGFSRTFTSGDVARSDDYIVAGACNGEPLTGSSAPLRLVGDGVAGDDGSPGGNAVGNIVRIEIPELQTPAAEPGSWNLTLTGKISDVLSQAEFEAGLACPNSGHLQEWTDGEGNVWSGIPLWLLTGWVDDRQPHDYNANRAMAGYTILVKAEDGYTKDFASTDVASSNDYIIANKCNGAPLTDSWPLRLVGDGVAGDDGSLGGTSVGNVVEIELTSFETDQSIPRVHIVKYAEDGITIIDEKTVDYLWMQENLEVIGDGETVYRFEGITNNPDDVWDADETYPGGFKIENAVKGTRIKDLCELVGGMGAGTEIVLVARDGYETRLPYSSIYPDPSVQKRQGDAILAWWADGEYVPDYADGMRLFFTPDDHIYGQWDMHETLAENYWHYYYSGNVRYPSCAGLATKWITEIKIYSVPQGDWTLELDGRAIGGLEYDVSKTYFEQALACQFGAEHKATYTDSKGRVWEGMPLWFLVGFIDDADQHSDNAFNDDLATAGYQVVITAKDGYSVTLGSEDIIRNNDYIVANAVNGAVIPESDSDWPLRLVGPAVSGSKSISQIVSIKLVSSGSGGGGSGGGGSGGGGSGGGDDGSDSVTQTETGVSKSIVTAEGGTVVCEQLSVEIPANVLPGDATINASKLTPDEADEVVPANMRVKLGSDIYEITTSGSRDFGDRAIEIKIAYDSSKIAAEEQPVVHYYDESAGEWVALETTTVQENGQWYAVTRVTHLTRFAVFSTAADEVPETIAIKLTAGQLKASINDVRYTLDVEPYIDTSAGRTLVPIRFISEALGAGVEWSAATRQVNITSAGRVITLTIGSQKVLVDGRESTIDCAPEILSGRTFLPLRFVGETLGAGVDFDAQTKEITITR